MRSLFAMRRAWRSSVQTRDVRWLGDRMDLSLRCEPQGDLEGEMGTMPSSFHKIAARISDHRRHHLAAAAATSAQQAHTIDSPRPLSLSLSMTHVRINTLA